MNNDCELFIGIFVYTRFRLHKNWLFNVDLKTLYIRHMLVKSINVYFFNYCLYVLGNCVVKTDFSLNVSAE